MFWWWPFWHVWGECHCSFDLHSSNNEWWLASFHVFISHLSSLMKCLLMELLPAFFRLGCLFFWYWVAWAPCIFWKLSLCQLGCSGGSSGEQPACQFRRLETQVQSLSGEDPLEKEMATCSSILAWEIPWTEEPGGLQSLGLQRVGHDWAHTHTLLSVVSFADLFSDFKGCLFILFIVSFEMAIHSSILAWRIPCVEEPGGLQSLGLQRVGHDWVTHTHTHT